jgi:hypothetical protein
MQINWVSERSIKVYQLLIRSLIIFCPCLLLATDDIIPDHFQRQVILMSSAVGLMIFTIAIIVRRHSGCCRLSTRSSNYETADPIKLFNSASCSRGSSVSIVSDYGLDDRAIGVRPPAGAKDFSSSLCVQTGSGAHPDSCTVGTEGSFPGGKSAAGA